MPKLKQKLAHPLFKSVLASTGFQQATYNSFGSLVASACAAIATILITRQLGPQKFGVFSTAFALVLIFAKLNDAGLSTATSKFVAGSNKKAEQNKYLNVITFLRSFLSLSLLLLGLIFSSFLSSRLKINIDLVIAALITSFAIVYFEHLQFSLQALHQFKAAIKANIIQACFKLGFTILFMILTGLKYFNPSIMLIFLIYTLSPGIPVLLTPLASAKTAKKIFNFKKPLKADKHFTQVTKLMSHSAISLISTGVIENVDILFVKAHLSDYDAGLLGGVSRVALLLYILAYAVGGVLNARVAKYHKKQDLEKYWSKAFLVMLLSAIGLLISLPLAKPLLVLTIGSQYLPGLNIMRIMLASGFLTLSVVPFIALFYSFDLPWYFSLTGLVQLAIVLVGNGVLVPQYGLEAAAWTRLSARAVLLFMTLSIALWYYRQKYLKKSS